MEFAAKRAGNRLPILGALEIAQNWPLQYSILDDLFEYIVANDRVGNKIHKLVGLPFAIGRQAQPDHHVNFTPNIRIKVG